MWLSKRRTFLAMLSAAALSGCGFTPAFAPDGAAAGLMGSVQATAPETRNDQHFVHQIESRLGRTNSPRYTLDYTLSVNEERMAITSSNITTRFNLVGEADYALRDSDTGQTLTQGKVSQFTGYSASGTTVATLSAERQAHERLSQILANLVVTKLIAAAADLPR